MSERGAPPETIASSETIGPSETIVPPGSRTIMCVLCFNSQWRSVVIGVSSSIISIILLLISIGYRDSIREHLEERVSAKGCYSYSQSDGGERQINWTSSMQNKENECVFFALTVFVPWFVWTTLSTYAILNSVLVVSAVYKWVPGVTAYLAVDALYLGLMATALCLSFFPTGLTRISLLTILFPIFSLALCAWMTVFGFYLRLEDRAKREEKRRLAKDVIQKGFHTYWPGPEIDAGQLEQVRDAAARLIESQQQIDNQFINLAFVPDNK